MKIRILIKENLYKIYNILDLIKNNDFLSKNDKNVQFYNEENWNIVFDKTVQDMRVNKQFDRLCIFDDDGILPFIFFTKQTGIITACPHNIDFSNLSRAHNNANAIIMSLKYLKSDYINDILNTFFTCQHDGGRHSTRVRLMQEPFKTSNKVYSFDETKKDTVLLCCDHAGFNLKQSIKKYLIEQKKMKVIDVGCNSTNSTHYPLFVTAMILNSNKASCAIGVCSTGVGVANTANKFKGINAFICSEPEQAKLARQKYNTNVIVFGAKQINFDRAKLAIDDFLKTPRGKSEFILAMDKYGYEFDFEKFKTIPLENNIEIPKELIK